MNAAKARMTGRAVLLVRAFLAHYFLSFVVLATLPSIIVWDMIGRMGRPITHPITDQ